MLVNALILSLREIRRNLMRSTLTVLGLVIGVGAVITMVTLGNGATLLVSKQVSSLGSNLIMIRPGKRLGPGQDAAGAAPFVWADVQALQDQVRGIQAVAPIVTRTVTVVAGNQNWSTSVIGSDNGYLSAGNWTLASGRRFSDDDLALGRPVCIVGQTVRESLFGRHDPIGSQIRVASFTCQVIGTLAAKGQAAMGMDQDDTILMPLRTVQRRLTGSRDISTINLAVKDGVDTDRVIAAIRGLLRERRKLSGTQDDDFGVVDAKQIVEALSGTIRTMTGLLGAVAAVSLLVGGIGIMNIMLVSVTERTREIGIRLAIGALEKEVLLQFLTEAIVLSAFGGLVGVIAAFIVCLGVTEAMDMPFVFDPGINLSAFGISVAVGVTFGFVPARHAAQLDPIEALRHE